MSQKMSLGSKPLKLVTVTKVSSWHLASGTAAPIRRQRVENEEKLPVHHQMGVEPKIGV